MPKLFVINDKSYYQADHLLTFAPDFFRGCINSRSIVQVKKLHKKSFIFARKNNDEWEESDGSSKKFDKLFILRKWARENIPEFGEDVKSGTTPNIVEMANKIKDLEYLVRYRELEKENVIKDLRILKGEKDNQILRLANIIESLKRDLKRVNKKPSRETVEEEEEQ